MKRTNVFGWLILFLLLGSLEPVMAQQTQPIVQSHQKISATQGGFTGILDNADSFGQSVVSIGDLDLDGVTDVAVGAPLDDDGGADTGAVWILFLNSNGTVKVHQKISATQGNFNSPFSFALLNPTDLFGSSVAPVGDLDGDGITELAVGATGDDTYWTSAGAVWILFLNRNGTVRTYQKIRSPMWQTGAFAFGYALTSMGDLNGDGISDLAVSTPYTTYITSSHQGAVWILFLNTNGTVNSNQMISMGYGNFTGILDSQDHFGSGVTMMGDMDGDGVNDLVVGAEGDDDGGPFNSNRGAFWLLLLNQNGTVKSYQKVSATQGGFTGTLVSSDKLGQSVASMGDIDGDGVNDLAIGSNNAVWTLFLNSNGTVKSHRKIIAGQEGFTGQFKPSNLLFGFPLHNIALLGDLDGNGVSDLMVGAPGDDDGGIDRGAALIISLQAPSLIMTSNIQHVSISTGATETLSIDAGPQYAGKGYMILGAFDTNPPIRIGNFTIPLAADFYFNMTLAGQNSWHLVNSSGVLDINGRAVSTVVWPQGLSSTLTGASAFHAVIIYEPTGSVGLRRVSAPSRITFVP